MACRGNVECGAGRNLGPDHAALTAPLRLEADVEQRTPYETCQLIMAGEEYVVQVKIRDEWVALYRFDLQEQFMSDSEVGNWYTSTYPTAHFVNELMAARAYLVLSRSIAAPISSRKAAITREFN